MLNTTQNSRLTRRRYDLVIVGGGIVGLATAREILLRYPNLHLLLLEKEPDLAAHQTGHNSGVIHTGIYYTPGSLKAKACVAGHTAMIDFCRENGIPFSLSGKLIVALDEVELVRLEELYRRGLTNGVQGLEMIDQKRLRNMEPHANGIRGLWSPTTGITDYIKVTNTFADHIRSRGGEIVTSCEVLTLTPSGSQTVLGLRLDGQTETEIETRFVVTCAGLYSDKMARLSEPTTADLKIVPFRGSYFILNPERNNLLQTGMLYPVPDPAYPFLGVHFTRRISGDIIIGPNAVLAFAREGYSRWKINYRDLADALGYPGFRRLAFKYWKTGIREMRDDYFKSAYLKALQRYMPELTASDLLPGPVGVRAQCLDQQGKLLDDFVIKAGPRIIHVLNAPSPAATSSLIIAKTIADSAQTNFEFGG